VAGAKAVSRPWRLFWVSVGVGPLIGLVLLVGSGLLLGLVRKLLLGLPGGDWATGSGLLVLGLPFAHIVGAVPAAISAGLNIAVARAVRSRPLRLLAAPFCGAASGLTYAPFATSMHEGHWAIVAMLTLCALTSLICVAGHERSGEMPPTPAG